MSDNYNQENGLLKGLQAIGRMIAPHLSGSRSDQEDEAPGSRRRWRDEIYEQYERNGYWSGTGDGAWTSSKHPDEWEHPHLK